MGDINFYLKKPVTPKDPSQIQLQFKYHGKRLRFQFGQAVDPKNWNSNKHRVKNNRLTTPDGAHLVNDLLDSLEEACLHFYNDQLKDGIPSPETLRGLLIQFLNRNLGDEKQKDPGLFDLIDRFISGEIKTKGRTKSKSSLQNYRAVKIHLERFEIVSRSRISFDTINLDFFYRYTSFLEKNLKLSVNTIAKDIRLLKVFLGEALDLGYTTNMQFKHKKFSYGETETDSVYLNDREIINLYRFDLSGNTKLEQVRNLFVFGCFVGLRFSDYSNVKPENIITIQNEKNELEYYLKMITQKTRDLIIIPCNPIVLDIFKKYSGNANRLPRALSNQKFNEYVKEVCKAAGLGEKGRLSTAPEKELWQCVSSHTARRSFATNLYLEGYPTIDIMKITGHKTEKSFLKYIRVSKLDAAKRLNDHIKRNWEDKLRKAERAQPADTLRVA
jgi:integrase